MECPLAGLVVTPRRFCIALAIAATTRSPLTPGSLPLLHTLISPLPLASPRSPLAKCWRYRSLLAYISAIEFPEFAGGAEHKNAAIFVEEAVDSIRSPAEMEDALEQYIGHVVVHGSLVPGKRVLEPDGPLGVFMRGVYARFRSLTFETMVILYNEFVEYVREECSSSREEHEQLQQTYYGDEHDTLIGKLKQAVSAGGFSLSKGCPIENDEDFQLLMRVNTDSKNGRAAVNIAVKEMSKIGRPKHDSMCIPGTEFVKHLEFCRRRDFTGALDSLHRYCDLALAEISTGRESINNSGDELSAKDAYAEAAAAILIGNQDLGFRPHEMGHQYASLSLARTYFQFGYKRHASAALDDTIRVAQQNGDTGCQADALRLIACTSNSTKQKLHLLQLAKSRLSLARAQLDAVITPSSVSASEETNFSKRNLYHLNACAAKRDWEINRNSGVSSGILTVDSFLVSAAAWMSLGSLPTALSVARIALHWARRMRPSVYPAEATSVDDEGVMWKDEAHALAAVAALEALDGNRESSIRTVRSAVNCLFKNRPIPSTGSRCEKSTSLPERLILQRCLNWLSFERALCLGQTRIAGYFCGRIESFAALAEASDIVARPDIELDALEARCRWLMACQSYEEAKVVNDALTRRSAILNRPARLVESQRLAAEILLKAGSVDCAFPVALAAVSLAQGLGLEAVYVRSVLTWVKIVLDIDKDGNASNIFAAEKALQLVMPHALEGLGAEERGNAYTLQGRCLMARHCSEVGLAKALPQIAECFESAVDAFQSSGFREGLCECYSLMAQLYNAVGRQPERDEAAKHYKSYLLQLADAREKTLN